jgi:hypothetical protein
MADVVEMSKWNVAVADAKELADKWQAAFDWKRFPNGKERVIVELWFNNGERE